MLKNSSDCLPPLSVEACVGSPRASTQLPVNVHAVYEFLPPRKLFVPGPTNGFRFEGIDDGEKELTVEIASDEKNYRSCEATP